MLALSGQLEAKGISMVMMHSTGGAGGGRFGTPGSVRECALTCVGFGCSFAAWPVGPLGTSQLVVSIGSWQAILVVRALFLVSAAATFMWMGLCGGGRGHGVRWSGLAALPFDWERGRPCMRRCLAATDVFSVFSRECSALARFAPSAAYSGGMAGLSASPCSFAHSFSLRSCARWPFPWEARLSYPSSSWLL